MTEPGTTPASTDPNAGGGDDSALDPGLFPGIDAVPAEYRQHLDPILKEVQTNANKRISELSEQNKAWEPYDELGVKNVDPETMQGLLGLYEVMAKAEDDPSGFQEWWEAVGKEYNFAGQVVEPGENAEELESDEYLSPEDLGKLVQEQVTSAMAPMLQQQQAQEQERLLQEADKGISEQLDAIKQEHGDFDESVEAAICKLALGYNGPDAIKQGFQEYKTIVENAKGELFAKKTTQPDKPEGPGTPNTSPEKITNFKDANAAARARLEQMQSS